MRTRTRLALAAAALAFVLGVLMGGGPPAHAATTRAPVKPRHVAALATSYSWHNYSHAFRTAAGSPVAYVTIGVLVANNGVCRWVSQFKWSPTNFTITQVIVAEHRPGQSGDLDTGWLWYGGRTGGYTSPAFTLSQMPCIDDTKGLQAHVQIWRSASIGAYGSAYYTI